jgi:hypothetical protein
MRYSAIAEASTTRYPILYAVQLFMLIFVSKRNKEKTFFSLRNTYVALKMHFVLTFFADYNRIDFNRMDYYTLIHIFMSIHDYTHIDTPVQEYRSSLVDKI